MTETSPQTGDEADLRAFCIVGDIDWDKADGRGTLSVNGKAV